MVDTKGVLTPEKHPGNCWIVQMADIYTREGEKRGEERRGCTDPADIATVHRYLHPAWRPCFFLPCQRPHSISCGRGRSRGCILVTHRTMQNCQLGSPTPGGFTCARSDVCIYIVFHTSIPIPCRSGTSISKAHFPGLFTQRVFCTDSHGSTFGKEQALNCRDY